LRPGAEDLNDVTNVKLPLNDIPLIITDGNGNGSATVVFEDDDADIIRGAALFLNAQATIFVSPMSPDSLGSSSALSARVVVPRASNNYDGDNRTDLAVFRPGATAADPSNWYVLNSRDGSFIPAAFGSRDDNVVAGDYNGDRITDYAVWRPANGTWYIADPSGVPAQNFTAVQWGISTDVPIAEDYDGDGRTDIAVFRPSQGAWYIRESSTGDPFVRQWGLAGDKLVPADYNGDGKAEVAVFRNGVWYISACAACTVRYEYFGLASDIPVPADYDGDGRIDIAVWRPSTGAWYINGSTIGFTAYQWGINGDKPLFGDYDGDGRTDISVFRPSDGNWYTRQSSNGNALARHFGLNGDLPIPSFEAKNHY
jgi:FG-GAP-like repeat